MVLGRAKNLSRRPLSTVPRPVRGREKLRRGRFSRKEQPAFDRRGQHRAVTGMSGQRMRI